MRCLKFESVGIRGVQMRIIRRPRLVRNCALERGPITTGVDCQEAVYRRCEIVRPRRMGPCVRRDD
jgi:hypothetical protein